MPLVAAKCTQCGADLQIDNTRDFFFCNYCGAKMFVEKQYIEHSGKVSISGMASEESLLERGFIFIKDGEFSKADEYFERVLDANPKNWRAYLGKLLCSLNLKSPEKLGMSYTPLTGNSLYNKAVEYAPANEKEQLLAYNEAILNRLQKQKEEKNRRIANMQADLDNLKDKANNLDQYIKNNTAKYVASSTTRVVLLVGMILAWFFGIIFFSVAFSMDDLFGTIFVIIISLLVIGVGVALCIARNKLKKSAEEYIQAKKDLEGTVKDMTDLDDNIRKSKR